MLPYSHGITPPHCVNIALDRHAVSVPCHYCYDYYPADVLPASILCILSVVRSAG